MLCWIFSICGSWCGQIWRGVVMNRPCDSHLILNVCKCVKTLGAGAFKYLSEEQLHTWLNKIILRQLKCLLNRVRWTAHNHNGRMFQKDGPAEKRGILFHIPVVCGQIEDFLAVPASVWMNEFFPALCSLPYDQYTFWLNSLAVQCT